MKHVLYFLLLVGCRADLNAPQANAEVDPNFFRCRVQPVLVKNCAMLDCHGSAQRFLRIYGRNRLRYGVTEETRNSMLTKIEIDSNYESARAFVDPSVPESSLLLTKPLDGDAGGWFHQGAVLFGEGNVFSSKDDPELEVLGQWTRGAKEDPSCIEPGSDLP